MLVPAVSLVRLTAPLPDSEHLPGIWVYLRELFLMDRHWLARRVEDQKAGARGPLSYAAHKDLLFACHARALVAYYDV